MRTDTGNTTNMIHRYFAGPAIIALCAMWLGCVNPDDGLRRHFKVLGQAEEQRHEVFVRTAESLARNDDGARKERERIAGRRGHVRSGFP